VAETSDFTGWVPAGTPHYSGFQNPVMTHLSPGNPVVDDWENSSLLFSIIVWYALAQELRQRSADSAFRLGPQATLMPNQPIAEMASSYHPGTGMWSGPGVRYYVC